MALVWDKSLFDDFYGSKTWTHGYQFQPGQKPRPPIFNYHWFGKQTAVNLRVKQLMQIPAFANASHLVIVGGAFGWTAEVFKAHGINAISVDTSDYIAANENVSEQAELRAALSAQGFDPDNIESQVRFMAPDQSGVLAKGQIWDYWLRPDNKRTSIPVEFEDMENALSRNKIRRRMNQNLDVILSEYAIESLENDNQSLILAERCQQLRPSKAVPVAHLISTGPGDLRMNFKSGAAWRALLDANGFADHKIFDIRGVSF